MPRLQQREAAVAAAEAALTKERRQWEEDRQWHASQDREARELSAKELADAEAALKEARLEAARTTAGIDSAKRELEVLTAQV
jgi:hypothetical protein